MSRCLVIGGGIAGLALAHALEAKGIEPLVLEADARAGGKLESRQIGGFLCESGPAGMLDGPQARQLLRSLDLEREIATANPAARRRGVVADGRLFEVPSGPYSLARSALLPLRAKLRLLGDLVLPRGPAGHGDDESIGHFARRRLGSGAAERLLYPLVSGLYAGDPELLSVSAMLPALSALERDHRSLLLGGIHALLTRRPGHWISFVEGMESLPRALARALGDQLHLETPVRRVTAVAGGFSVALDPASGQDQLSGDACAIAAPAHAAGALVAALAPALPVALDAIPYVPVVGVHLGYPASAFAAVPDGYGFLVAPGERSHLLGAVFSSAVLPGRAPGSDVLISARLGGVRHAELLALPDEELAQRVEIELAALLGVRGPASFVAVTRHPHALPQYTLGHAGRVAAVDAAERAHPGLYFTGAAYRGIGVPDLLRGAETLATRIAGDLAARRAAA